MNKYLIEDVPSEDFIIDKSKFQMINFKNGKLNTYINGPENGERILFIHGLSYFTDMYSAMIN